MVSSRKISDYPTLMHPENINGVSEANASVLQSYIDTRRLNGIGLYTLKIDVERLAGWIRLIGKDNVMDWTLQDISSAYLKRLDKVANGEASGTTLDVDLRTLKIFWKHINPDKPPITIHKKRTKVHLDSDKIVSVKQVLDMKLAAESSGELRDAALIMTVLGTGCRISELLDATIGDVEIGRQYAKIRVDGKTGRRTIPFVTGLPELQTWINCHPLKDDPSAPLFVTKYTRGRGIHKLSRKVVEWTFDKYAKRAGVPDNVKSNPHAIRHLSASQDDRYFTHQEMCLKYGWSPNSDMPKNYTHSNYDELKQTVISVAGIETPEKIEPTATVNQCPRCKFVNSAGAKYCSECSLVLDKNLNLMYLNAVNDLSDPDVMSIISDAKNKQKKNQNT